MKFLGHKKRIWSRGSSTPSSHGARVDQSLRMRGSAISPQGSAERVDRGHNGPQKNITEGRPGHHNRWLGWLNQRWQHFYGWPVSTRMTRVRHQVDYVMALRNFEFTPVPHDRRINKLKNSRKPVVCLHKSCNSKACCNWINSASIIKLGINYSVDLIVCPIMSSGWTGRWLRNGDGSSLRPTMAVIGRTNRRLIYVR